VLEEQQQTPQTSPADASSTVEDVTAPDQEMFVIPRAVFNYLFIALAAALIGGGIGYSIAAQGSRDVEETVRIAVGAALDAAQNNNGLDESSLASVNPILREQVMRGVRNAFSSRNINLLPRYSEVSIDDDPSLGPADAPVTIIEFSDFGCGFCGRFANETLPLILQAYPQQVRYVYRDYPVPISQFSQEAARAAECADNQGKFWDMHTLLFNNQRNFSREGFINFGQQLGVDVRNSHSVMTTTKPPPKSSQIGKPPSR
jgi:hypothetical protein